MPENFALPPNPVSPPAASGAMRSVALTLEGGIKGGLGTASVVLESGITVAALVAANPGGSVVDPDTGRQFQAVIDYFRGKLNFHISANGETHLAAIRMGRDQYCLEHWRMVQRQLEGRFVGCVVE